MGRLWHREVQGNGFLSGRKNHETRRYASRAVTGRKDSWHARCIPGGPICRSRVNKNGVLARKANCGKSDLTSVFFQTWPTPLVRSPHPGGLCIEAINKNLKLQALPCVNPQHTSPT